MQAKDLVGRHINLTIYFWGGSVRCGGLVKAIEETDCVGVGPCFLKANAELIESEDPGFYRHHATTAQRQAEREEVRS